VEQVNAKGVYTARGDFATPPAWGPGGAGVGAGRALRGNNHGVQFLLS